ncbi:16S rRNA (adenine(1518)-N(6)/adenine(1519)-N(6))-dimethyltransferase RsmA [Marispirochaeta aestuarii]|uniref:16S rRNA (adenine(1518)-N(6)/adenine(1519)-N(6))- dimethyltransferase RsmA n=1 Tax=Marispirochaeta aestuarii TaxID=1963862 RepID=UPI001301A2AE|nr:16S rRNA (adenine(1518)-N(6)/adenine(1519)-N(6))-dimethyltransferase RsmA [Marispirochaeta aestuarii]
MSDLNLWDSKQKIRALLEEKGIQLKKRFGQNFLLDPNHRRRILSALELPAGAKVWEIGPGIGSLTHGLLEMTGDLTVFEIDHGLIRILKDLFGSSISIVEGDFLRTFRDTARNSSLPRRIIGNLPYSSGSVMIGSLVEEDLLPDVAVFTLQKEVADRMLAQPGGKDYSAFSLVCQLRNRVEKICDVGGAAFFPPPQVVSSVVRLRRRPDAPEGPQQDYFTAVHDLFRSRRKTAANNLKGGGLKSRYSWESMKNAAELSGLDLGRRGETFSRDEVLSFTRALSDFQSPEAS